MESEEADLGQELLQAPAPTAEEPGEKDGAGHLLHTQISTMVPWALLSLLTFPPKIPCVYYIISDVLFRCLFANEKQDSLVTR